MEENRPVRNTESINITLETIINEIAGCVSLSDFQDNVTTLKNKDQVTEALYNMHTHDIVEENSQIIDKMFSETNLHAKYDEITKLINDSKVDENIEAWRPVPGNCELQLEAYKKKCLIEKKAKLEKLVQEQQSARLLLKQCLDHKRAQVETLKKNMETAKTKLLETENSILKY